MSPLVTGAPSSSACPNAANLPGRRPAAIAVAPAPRAPFFRNDRRLLFCFVRFSDCFIVSPLFFVNIKIVFALHLIDPLERQVSMAVSEGLLVIATSQISKFTVTQSRQFKRDSSHGW